MEKYVKPTITSLGSVADKTLLDKSFGGPADGVFLVVGSTKTPLTNASNVI